MKLAQQNMFYGLNLPDEFPDLDTAAKNPAIPVMVLPGALWQEIRYITHKLSNSEYAVFLTLERLDPRRPHFMAKNIFMPKQEASSGGVSLDTKDCAAIWENLKKENVPHRHICHLHSHASINVFWSSVDNEQQLTPNDLGFLDDFRFYIVVNVKDEIKCSFVNYRPVLFRVDAAVALSFSQPEHCQCLTSARKKELDALIAEKLVVRKPLLRPVSSFSQATEEAKPKTSSRYHSFAQLPIQIEIGNLSPTLKSLGADREAITLFAMSAGCQADDPLARNVFLWFADILLEHGISEKTIRRDPETMGGFVGELLDVLSGHPLAEEYISYESGKNLFQSPDRNAEIHRITAAELVPLYEDFEADVQTGASNYSFGSEWIAAQKELNR